MSSCAKIARYIPFYHPKASDEVLDQPEKTKEGVSYLSKFIKASIISGIILVGVGAVAITILGIVLTLPSGGGLVVFCGSVGGGIGAGAAATITFLSNHAVIVIIVGGTTAGASVVVGLVAITFFAWKSKKNELPDRENTIDETDPDTSSIEEEEEV